MTREELREHCERQIQQFERVEKIMPITPNDWKRYEEHKLILELLEQESILEKIRTEIQETYINITYQENKDRQASWGLRKALKIIDKYKAESGELKGEQK